MISLVREKYLSRIRPFYHDRDMIKVISGVRRCGKSTLMRQIMDELRDLGVSDSDLVYIDLDSKENFSVDTPEELESKIDSMMPHNQSRAYLFLDEIQNVDGFEPLVNAYCNDGVSVFIAGSNSYLLSGELVTKLTGRYIEFNIGTFSFSEVRDYFTVNGIEFDRYRELERYLQYGGYPKRFSYSNRDSQAIYIKNIVDETVEKDIFLHRKIKDRNQLRKVLDYVLSTPGAELSSTSISNHLRSEHIDILPSTVNRYLDVIFSAKLAMKCQRFDINGKKSMKTLYKSYVSDLALHTMYPDHRNNLRKGALIENLVFNELVSRGFGVSLGKLRDSEVDFVVRWEDKIAYVQVTYMMESDETRNRETAPLLKIRDAYPKYIISMDSIRGNIDGIKVLHLIDDFLLGDGFRID